MPYLDEDTVKLHLYKNGFRLNYYQCTYHGELDANLRVKSSMSASIRCEVNQTRDMFVDTLGLCLLLGIKNYEVTLEKIQILK